MGDAVQAIQSLTSDAFISISATASAIQEIQSSSIVCTVKYPFSLQAKQWVNSQAFIGISADCVISQDQQSIQSSSFYYDIAINASMTQPLQGVMIDAQVSVATEVIYLEQPKQYMSCAAIAAVITAQTARQLNNRAWILRAVRNKGER